MEFIESNPYELVGSFDEGASEYVFRAKERRTAPPRLGAMFGDALRGVSDAPRLLIEELQPYNRLDPERMALVYVHRFSNQDKHRTSLNFTAAIEDPRGKPSRFGKMKDLAPQGDAIFRINEPLKEDTKLIRVPAAKTGPEPYMEVEGETAFDIAFGDRPPLKVEGIPPTLGEVIRVIRRFEPFFERLSA